MHLQGKEIISLSTQRSARALTAIALVIVLVKHYEVLPTDLTLVGVTISQTAVSGAVFWAVSFQLINHLVHWYGDFQALWSWSSSEKVNGVARLSAGSHVLSKLDKTIESIDDFLESRREDQTRPKGNRFEDGYSDHIAKELTAMRYEFSELKPSIKSYRTFGAFYFFEWFLVLPLLIAVAAILWPELSGSATSSGIPAD